MKVELVMMHMCDGRLEFRKCIQLCIPTPSKGTFADIQLNGLVHKALNHDGDEFMKDVFEKLTENSIEAYIDIEMQKLQKGILVVALLLDSVFVSFDMLNNITSWATHPEEVIQHKEEIIRTLQKHITSYGSIATCIDWYIRQLAQHQKFQEQNKLIERRMKTLHEE